MNMKRSDLVTIIAVISVLLLLVLVAMKKVQRSRTMAARVSCVSNLKHVGLSFRIYANDHLDQYPMAVAEAEGGAKEAIAKGDLVRVFQVMSNELAYPKTINCRADNRWPAVDWLSLVSTNISYIVGSDAKEMSEMVLSGDRNLAIDGKLLSGAVALGTNSPVAWTRAIHGEEGNIVPGDGSVRYMTTELLRQQLRDSGDATNLLVFPQ